MPRKIDLLISAITEEEGWLPVGSKEAPNGSVSYRNHNPGNLRKSAYEYLNQNGYSVFKNDEIGRLALHLDILEKAAGKTSTGLGPNSTLRDLIFKYAPNSDNNDSENYLAYVVKRTGLPEGTKLSEIFN